MIRRSVFLERIALFGPYQKGLSSHKHNTHNWAVLLKALLLPGADIYAKKRSFSVTRVLNSGRLHEGHSITSAPALKLKLLPQALTLISIPVTWMDAPYLCSPVGWQMTTVAAGCRVDST